MRKRTLMALLTKVGTPQSPIVELSYDNDGLLITIEDQGTRATKAYPEEVLEILDEVLVDTAPHGYLPRLVAPPLPRPEPKPEPKLVAPPAPEPEPAPAPEPEPDLPPQAEKALALVREHTRNGPVRTSVLHREASLKGVSRTAIYRAKRETGLFGSRRRVDSTGSPREWEVFWKGPQKLWTIPLPPGRLPHDSLWSQPEPPRQCPCSIGLGVRCPNPTQKMRRRCAEHVGANDGLHLSPRQKVTLKRLDQGLRLRPQAHISRTLRGLADRGLIHWRGDSARNPGIMSPGITDWGHDVVKGMRR